MSISQYPSSAALHRRKRLEILIPSFLLLLSLVLVGGLTYRLLRGSDEGTKAAYIPQGVQVYHVYQGDTCIGSLESTTEEGKLLQWRLLGSLHLDDQGSIAPAEISVGSFFNPLDQLFQSLLRIQYRDMALKIHLENVHPIDIDVSAQSGSFTFSRRFRLPGPIMFEPAKMPNPQAVASSVASGELIPAYVLRYHYLSGLVPEPAERSSEQILSSLQLRLEAASQEFRCDTPGALVVDRIRQALLAISPAVLKNGLKGMEGFGWSQSEGQNLSPQGQGESR